MCLIQRLRGRQDKFTTPVWPQCALWFPPVSSHVLRKPIVGCCVNVGGVTKVCGHPEKSPRHKVSPSLISESELAVTTHHKDRMSMNNESDSSNQGKAGRNQGPGPPRRLPGILRGDVWIASHTNCRLQVSSLSY